MRKIGLKNENLQRQARQKTKDALSGAIRHYSYTHPSHKLIMPAGRPKKSRRTKAVAPLSTADKQRAIAKAFCNALRFEKTEDLDVWSDANRVLPKETSSEYGPWRTSRFPFLRRIMKCLSPSSIATELVFMKGGQLGGTEVSINWMLYSAECDPGPMAYVQKTGDAVKDFVKQKYKPAIRACDAVAYTLGDKKPLGYSRSLLNLGYPGGFQAFGAANSTDFLKSKSLAKGVMDEEDQYALNIDSQGSPRKMLDKRMANFPGSKLYRISTPIVKEQSTIEPGFYAGSQELYYVPCPNCNPTGDDTQFMFTLEQEHLCWTKEVDPKTNDPLRVWMECPSCGYDIDEADHKTWMLDKGDWFSTKNPDNPEEPLPRYRVGDVKYPSWRLPSFYSPLGFYSWAKAVHDWLEATHTKDITLLQVYINQCCAQTFSLIGGDIDHSGLYNRREPYKNQQGDFDVPVHALCLTAGVDVQEDRIELEVVGWGVMDESFSVDYKILVGDTSLMGNQWGILSDGRPSVWRLLHDYLSKRFRHETGVSMPIEFTMIDTGYRSDEVHKFCLPREGMRIYPLKGASGWGNGLWRRATRRHEKYKTIDYRAFVDELKAKTYSFLKITDPGPGYCHFPLTPIYNERHFRAMTAEKQLTRMVRGQLQLYWDNPSGRRNEQLDCRNYAYVAHSAYTCNLEQRAKFGLQSIFGQHQAPAQRKRRRGSPGIT